MTTATDKITAAEREAIDAAPVTKVKAGRARGVNKRTAPMTMTKPTKAQRGRVKRSTTKAAAPKAKANTSRPAGTFTTVDLAEKQGISAKTLRARIRRNIEAWESLFVDGQRHVFKDNKTTWSKAEALLA